MLFETFKFQIKCLYMNIVSANMYQSSLWNRFQNRCLLILNRKMYESPSISLREVKSITPALYISLKFADIRVNFSKITKCLRFIAYLIFVNIKFKFWSFASFKLTIVEDLHFEVWLFGHHHFWSIGNYPPTAYICFHISYEFIQLNFISIFQILRWGGGGHICLLRQVLFLFGP